MIPLCFFMMRDLIFFNEVSNWGCMVYDPDEIKRFDKDYVWHPFTQMKDWEGEQHPIIVSGEGNYLFDIDGKKYFDGVSSLWVTVHGHRKKEIDSAIKNQIDKISHSTMLGLSNEPATILAKKLVEITPPGLDKVFYSDSGSTSVEIALKMAFQYWQQTGKKAKQKFLTFHNAYHGDTIGSVSLGGMDLFHKIYQPLLFHTYQCDFNEVEKFIKNHHQELAALVIEPLVQGAAGMLIQPEGFLKKVRKLCDDYEVLLICDEVATGFGRTGKMFACDHDLISPDIMCLAKGITGGYLPLAATLTTQEIYRGFYGDYQELKTFFHGHTYTGNPLASAAALANLELFEKEKVIEGLSDKVNQFSKKLEEIERLNHVKEIRQVGLMIGIELIHDKGKNIPYDWEDKMGIQVILNAREKGLIIRPLGNVVVLMPPLSISSEEIDWLVDVVRGSVEEVTE